MGFQVVCRHKTADDARDIHIERARVLLGGERGFIRAVCQFCGSVIFLLHRHVSAVNFLCLRRFFGVFPVGTDPRFQFFGKRGGRFRRKAQRSQALGRRTLRLLHRRSLLRRRFLFHLRGLRQRVGAAFCGLLPLNQLGGMSHGLGNVFGRKAGKRPAVEKRIPRSLAVQL